jgi:hypothetical protein
VGIPGEARPPPRAHVDSDILRYVFDPLEDRDLKDEARRLCFPAGTHPKPPVCCSGPAAAEFLVVLAHDRADDRDAFLEAVGGFWNYVQEGRLGIFMFGERNTEAFSLAAAIQRKDPRIDATDAAIVACFLADEDASVLYTTDRDVSMSRVIREMVRERDKTIKGL